MLSVLQVAYPFAPVSDDAVGGAEHIVARLDAALVARGHRSYVVACAGSQLAGELYEVPAVDGVIDARSGAAVHAAVRDAIARALAEWRIDVVHFHGVDFDAYLPRGVPAVVTLHLPLDCYRSAALAAPVTYVCVSDSQRRTCRVPALTVANGVALDAYRPRGRSAGYALALGRICPEKGFDLALAAAGAAGMALIIAGRAFGYVDHVRYFDEVLMPRVRPPHRWIGALGGARKRRLLAAAACVVVPSRIAETSSLVAMEALASGTPVVARPVGALPEIIEHGRTGFLATGVEELAAAMRRAGTISRVACREAAEARFSDQHMLDRYFAIYEAHARPRRRATHVVTDELQSLVQLELVAPEWTRLWERTSVTTPFQHPAWLIAWCRHLGGAPLRVVTVRVAGRLAAVIPFGLMPGGALALLAGDVSDYADALVEPGAEAAVTRALAELLARSGRPCAVAGLPMDSLLARAALPEARDPEPDGTCPVLALRAGTPHGAALPPGFAHRLAYARRRATRDGLHVDDLAGGDPGEYLDALFRLHSARWAPRGQTGALADAAVERLHREAAASFHRAGMLAMHGLRDGDGRLVAVSYGFLAKGRGYLYLSGFDPALARSSPGALVIDRAIAAAQAAGARSYDFLRGAEAYKYRWGARDRFRVRRVLHAATSDVASAAP